MRAASAVFFLALVAGCTPPGTPDTSSDDTVDSAAVAPDTDAETDGETDAVAPDTDTDRPAQAPTPNVLVVVLDDIGTDQVGAYAVHPNPAVTPSLDALAARGVLFDNAIGQPVCSSARAALLTGLHPFRTGVGMALSPTTTFELDTGLLSLPRALTQVQPDPWTAVAVGKWHLTGQRRPAWDHALRVGFQHHRGTTGNLVGELADGTGPQTYFSYDKVIDGVQGRSDVYATTDSTEDAILAVSEVPGPWFVYVAYHGAHFPWHVPPEDLLAGPLPSPMTDHLRSRLMIESVDHELGRLLAAVPSNTWVFVLSDNGSSDTAVESPWRTNQSKGTLYRGGVRIPLLVSGPGVDRPGRRVDDLVQLTDLMPTILELVDATPVTGIDGISFAPLLLDRRAVGTRAYAYAEKFEPVGPGPYTQDNRMVRDARHKLIRTFSSDGLDWSDELYDLTADPLERTNLLQGASPSGSARAIADALAAQLPR